MRRIKRYENRKLYDLEASSYVSLRDVAALVQEGETVKVIDNVTGEDITAQTLTNVILEEGRRGSATLTPDMLHTLLRRGSDVLDSGIAQVRSSIDDLVGPSVQNLPGLAHIASREDIDQLQDQLRDLEETIDGLVARANGGNGDATNGS